MKQTNQLQSESQHYKIWFETKKYFKNNRTTYLNEGKNYNPIVELRQYNYIVIYIVISLFYLFILFLHTKHSHSFIKLRLNHWSHGLF